MRWQRVAWAGGITVGLAVALKVAQYVVQWERDAFLATHPNAKIVETTHASLSGIPVIGGLISTFADPVIAATSPDAAKVIKYDDDIAHLALAQVAVGVLGGAAVAIFLVRDVLMPPKPRPVVALPTVSATTPTGVGATVVPPSVAEQMEAAKT